MIMVLAVFATFAVLAYQFLVWLKSGYWTPVSGKHFFEFLGIGSPDLEWRGLEKILQFFYEIHIGFTFVMVALLLGVVLDAVETENHDENQNNVYKHRDSNGDTGYKDRKKNKKTRRIREEEKIEPKLLDNDRDINDGRRDR